MLYIGIPAFNEATTIGVLLWRLRSVLADVSREYEVVVYDDASTDQTAETLEPYRRVLPLTVLRGASRVGYGGAVDAIARHVAKATRYPRRDALLLLQGDFTDPPALVPEFLRRFEGGADLIIGERTVGEDAPQEVRRLWKAARWVLRPFVGITDVRDLTSSYRLVRIAVLRDLIKASPSAPIADGDAWNANVDFALRAAALSRRVETIPVSPTFDVRTRESRRTAWPDAIALAKWGWRRRGDRVAVRVIARIAEVTEPVEEDAPATEPADHGAPERRERTSRPERSGRSERKPRRDRGGRGRAEASGDPPRRRSERTDQPRRERGSGRTRSGAPTASSLVPTAEAGGPPSAGESGTELQANGAGAEAETANPGEGRTRKPRPRRRRGGRKERPAGEAALDGRAPDAAQGAIDAAAATNGTGDSGATLPAPEADAKRASASRSDGAPPEGGASESIVSGDEGTGAPRKRRRSRRGRRKRPEGEATGTRDGAEGEQGSSDRETSPADRPTGRRGGGAPASGASGAPDGAMEGDGAEREGARGEGARGEGAAHDGSTAEGAEGTPRPKRRRSRRGRRGGGRRREGGAEETPDATSEGATDRSPNGSAGESGPVAPPTAAPPAPEPRAPEPRAPEPPAAD